MSNLAHHLITIWTWLETVHDSCRQLGSVYTNAFVLVPMDVLSTVSFDLPVG